MLSTGIRSWSQNFWLHCSSGFNQVDSGKILAQAPVRIMDSDTIDTLTQKIHRRHVILPSSIADLSFNRDLSLEINNDQCNL